MLKILNNNRAKQILSKFKKKTTAFKREIKAFQKDEKYKRWYFVSQENIHLEDASVFNSLDTCTLFLLNLGKIKF